MVNDRDPVVMRAIQNVQSRYTLDEWIMLDPRRVTEEIYHEVRRLDLEMARMKEAASQLRPGKPKSRKLPKLVEGPGRPIVWAAE